MTRHYTTLELAKVYPEAFQALPEIYQADSCLDFWKEDGKLYCAPLEDQTEILGDWLVEFDSGYWYDSRRPDCDEPAF